MALIAFTGSCTERRQLSAVKRKLDQEYEAQVDLNYKPSKGAAQTKYRAVLRLDPRWWLQLCETLCCAFKQVTQVDCFETSY
jgi:hypothetical protein